MPVILAPAIVEKHGRVYRGKKRSEEDEERLALAELQSILSSKNRKPCDCEAQVHDLLENCLNCGRLTCVAEGSGKCFHCASIVLSQEQRERLKKYVDIDQSFEPTPSTSQGSRIKIVDNQFDEASIENRRHLREGDKKALKDSLNELQSKRYQRKLVIDVDLGNLEALTTSAPLIDNYSEEIKKLQISDPKPGPSGGCTYNPKPTLMEVMERETNKVKQTGGKQLPNKSPKQKKGNQHRSGKQARPTTLS